MMMGKKNKEREWGDVSAESNNEIERERRNLFHSFLQNLTFDCYKLLNVTLFCSNASFVCIPRVGFIHRRHAEMWVI